MSRTKLLFYFLIANYILALIIAFPYLDHGPEFSQTGPWLYTRMAYMSTFFLHLMAVGLILLPFTWMIRSPIQLYVLPPTVLTLYHTFIFFDVHIYKLFRFHINGLVLNVLSTEGAYDSIQLGSGTVFTFVSFVAILVTLEWGIVWGLRYFTDRFVKWVPGSPLLATALLASLVLIVTIGLAEKTMFAYASYRNDAQITRYKRLLPLYLPVTANHFLYNYFGGSRDPLPIEYNSKATLLKYPLKELNLREGLKPINMVWVVIESWRFDTMNQENTPDIWKFGEGAWVFNNHYSGGNASRFGIFSLFYGIYGTYWHQFLAERQSPVLLDVLQQMDYEFQIISSTRLTFPEFRKTAFRNIPGEAIMDQLPAKEAPDRDAMIPEKFSEWLDVRDKERPFFAFMWLDAPHSPYRYPVEYNHYPVAKGGINYLKSSYSDKELSRFFNRYRNSVYYSDAVVGRILHAVEERGLLESTLVLITGDHGQEFNENGYWGHNSAFTRYQAGVPLVLYIPGKTPGVLNDLSSHMDIVPTVFQLMGSEIDSSYYSHGRSLLKPGGSPYTVVSSWNTFAVIDPEVTMVFSLEIYNATQAEVREPSYRLVEDSKPLLNSKKAQLLKVTRNLGSFLK